MPFGLRPNAKMRMAMATTARQNREASLPNPLREGLRVPRTPDPCALVIFGASGDLTRRKLFPAVYSLAVRNLLPERFAIVGVARTEETDAQFRAAMKEAVRTFGRDKLDEQVWQRLAAGMHYVATDFASDGGENALVDLLAKLDEERGTAGNRLFYLAVPPMAISVLADRLGHRRDEWHGWTRLIVEKPFGSDRASAQRLNEEFGRFFEEHEIYRIDHYLGKETVQNLLALRFANGIFEPIWNRQFVDHVEITVAESIGIEGRSAFYEQAGAIRDVFQNHLLQLVALTAMEPPVDFTSESVRNEKVKVLRAMHAPPAKHVVRGQYGRGFIEGEQVPGYREEPGVARGSRTETFVAAKLHVDNWRWADTPFYVRTGKRLPKRETTIAIQFQRAPHPPFADQASDGLRPNVLIVHVQPNEGVSLAIGAKVPGQGMRLRTVNMDFLYGGAFRTELPEAYERLILDSLLGDATLFTRADEVDEQWALVDAIVAGWKRERASFPNYDAGTWGPAAAGELLRRDGREWRRR
jgi:glucose-6-phosphate 1-dehydrogenase